MRYYDSIPKIPAAAISTIGAEKLSAALKSDPDLVVQMTMDCRLMGDVQSYNVIGQITGSEHPEEVVLIGAHLDSWDKGTGAHDDGAGVVQCIDAMRMINNLGDKPKRTIRCVLFANEENGIRGARTYAAWAQQSSDVHIEPQRSRLRIRFRVDGKLEEVAALPASLNQPVISRVKVLARLKLDETRTPQDGRFRTMLLGRDIDFRVATFPTPNGEKIAIRVLDPTTGLKGLNELGLYQYNTKVLEEAVRRPFGMILISGPTGSGKTTTLYAMMQELNNTEANVVSLEDPVEYFMEGMNQSQVRPEIGYTFASGLRQILRQDPDVIMVGEIRDAETANLAVNAALTGHIVLSTIHTNNAIGVIPRLVDLEVPPFLLSSALNLMIAQRLVLRLCPECREAVTAPDEVQKYIEETIASLPKRAREAVKVRAPYTIYKARPGKKDCKVCKGKGVSGRIALFEMFSMTRELSDLVNSGFTEGKITDEAKRQEMVTLREDGVVKALDGMIAIEEVMRETV